MKCRSFYSVIPIVHFDDSKYIRAITGPQIFQKNFGKTTTDFPGNPLNNWLEDRRIPPTMSGQKWEATFGQMSHKEILK